MVYDFTVWSPAVATHIEAVVAEPGFLAFTQPFHPAMQARAKAASTQRDFMCILSPEEAM
jgi:hypothetical protein